MGCYTTNHYRASPMLNSWNKILQLVISYSPRLFISKISNFTSSLNPTLFQKAWESVKWLFVKLSSLALLVVQMLTYSLCVLPCKPLTFSASLLRKIFCYFNRTTLPSLLNFSYNLTNFSITHVMWTIGQLWHWK